MIYHILFYRECLYFCKLLLFYFKTNLELNPRSDSIHVYQNVLWILFVVNFVCNFKLAWKLLWQLITSSAMHVRQKIAVKLIFYQVFQNMCLYLELALILTDPSHFTFKLLSVWSPVKNDLHMDAESQ